MNKKKLLSCLYDCAVIHKRVIPFEHKFKYNVYSLFIDYDELSELSKNISFFSYNKFNFISFYDIDHGFRNGNSLKNYVNLNLNKYKINTKNLKIKILCFPRILGYVFNPISIIYCYKMNNLVAIFYEVKNTSHEQHTYIFINKNNKKRKNYIHKCNKKFYVSPFNKNEGYYIFNITEPKNKISIYIKQYLSNNSLLLYASQIGYQKKFSAKNLIKSFIRYPFLTFYVMFSIHWQAFKILLKGGKYYHRIPKIIDTQSFEGKIID